MRVLLIEDDESLGEAICAGLKQDGYTVDWVKEGESGQQAALTETFETIVLDLGLPKLHGLKLLKNIRTKGVVTPVIILTAMGDVEHRVSGLDAGADDYIYKPFDMDELCARMRALHRRSAERARAILAHNQIKMDPAAHIVYLNEENISVSRREFALLQKLLENAGRVLSREQLTQTLYGWGDDIDSNALEVHIHNLRKKFGTELIRTIRGVGYMVDLPETAEEEIKEKA